MMQLNDAAREALAQSLDYHARAAEDARGEQQRAQSRADEAAAAAAHHEQRAEELRQTLRAAGEQPIDPGHLPALA